MPLTRRIASPAGSLKCTGSGNWQGRPQAEGEKSAGHQRSRNPHPIWAGLESARAALAGILKSHVERLGKADADATVLHSPFASCASWTGISSAKFSVTHSLDSSSSPLFFSCRNWYV